MAKSYYAILGLTSVASHDDVKAAYRRLAKQYHPDIYSGTRDVFLDIQEAYSVLGDRGQRREYDDALLEIRSRRGSAGSRQTPEPLVPDRQPADLGDISPIRSFETFYPSFDEVFDWLWSSFRGLARPKTGTVRNLTLEVPITHAQAQRGGHARILVPASANCPVCRGRGGVGYYECMRCAGEGRIDGEYPLSISYPAGLMQDHAVLVPLDRFGIHNTYLTVHFRLTAQSEDE
jgi:DnaJ-class molecular chaperone